MKTIKSIISFALCAIAFFSVTACAKENKATEYGLVHGHYVGAITVRVSGTDIKSVDIKEVEAPYSWAKISNISTDISEADRTTNNAYTGTATPTTYAKKIAIDGVIFTARDNAETNNYVYYFNVDKNDNTSFENWLKVSENAKWYFDAMTSGKYDVIKADDSSYNVEFKNASVGSLSKSDRWLKNKNGYWASTETALGWSGNMEAISNYIVANGFEDYKAERESLTSDGEYVINGVNTGATVVDFKDYMDLALKAHDKAQQA